MGPESRVEPRLLIATRSGHKLRELRDLLALPHTELVSLDDVEVGETPSEDADTFEENAVGKARFYCERARLPTLADDSGLEVDALGGQPGVRSHRYAGPDASDEENNQKLLKALEGVAPGRRTARYRCALAYLPASGADPVVRIGTLEGRISIAPKGTGGFGYDPIFEPETEPIGARTIGLFTADEKNQISHRAQAARAMGDYLRSLVF